MKIKEIIEELKKLEQESDLVLQDEHGYETLFLDYKYSVHQGVLYKDEFYPGDEKDSIFYMCDNEETEMTYEQMLNELERRGECYKKAICIRILVN